MPAVDAKHRIESQLQEAIDRLRADLVRVELWANALNGFSQPIPEYQPGDGVTRHLLPRCSDERNSSELGEPVGAPEYSGQRGEH